MVIKAARFVHPGHIKAIGIYGFQFRILTATHYFEARQIFHQTKVVVILFRTRLKRSRAFNL